MEKSMLNNAIKSLVVTAVLLIGGLTAANAQIANGASVKFDVSHAFVVNDKTFPAGKYSISPVSMPDGSTSLLKLQSENGEESALINTMSRTLNERSKETELVFDQVGGEYILTELRVRGDEQASRVVETSSEKRAAATAAAVEN
jgi:hypothetical protein